MAQIIALKRSAQPNKKPDTGSLNLGEIAINTYDGKAFLKRSGSIYSVEEFIITNAINTGSITITETGSFGELYVTQDANIQRDLYVTRDIISNGDVDAGGNISGSGIQILNSSKFGTIPTNTHIFTGSVSISGSLLINGVPAGGPLPGPNTFDFNLDPNAAGTVNYIEDSTNTTRIFAHAISASVVIADITILSVSTSSMNVTTGSNTANFMHLVKYITPIGDLDFNA